MLVAITSARGLVVPQSLQRGYRVAVALLAVAAEQERFHLAHRTYSERLDATRGRTTRLPVARSPAPAISALVEQADAADLRRGDRASRRLRG